MLSEPEAKAVLAAYSIPVVDTRIARTIEEAVKVAAEIGFPVALKILSPEITHKSDVGGVALDLENALAVDAAANAMRKRLQQYRPNATLQGFTVQSMARRPNAQELIVGVTTDAVFGPVILFGQGGTAVEVIADRAIGLPPLNRGARARAHLAHPRFQTACRLPRAHARGPYRDQPDADSGVASDRRHSADRRTRHQPAFGRRPGGSCARCAHARRAPSAASGVDRFAIRPYPEELEEWIDWQGRRVLLRPIKPEDGTQHVEFFNALDPEDVHFRVFMQMRELQRPQLARLTQIDYDREMAFIATCEREPGRFETLGVARAMADPDNISAEFAIIVRSDLKGKGLGPILLRKLIAYCRSRGTKEIVGEALADNQRVLRLVRHFGGAITHSEPGTVRFRFDLASSGSVS